MFFSFFISVWYVCVSTFLPSVMSYSSYPKVARWGALPSGSGFTHKIDSIKNINSTAVPSNHRSENHTRKLNFATNNMGVTYYYSKAVPQVDESKYFPDTGEIYQSPENYRHKSSYVYKHQSHPNEKSDGDVSGDIQPPALNHGSVGGYSHYGSYNSPYTSYNPPQQSAPPTENDFVQYPPNDGSISSQTQYGKVPLTEMFGSSQNNENNENNENYSDVYDSYNTPKAPKGSVPKPAPVYGPPQSNPSQTSTSEQTKLYKFPDPFPVPHVVDSNEQSPPATSYGVPDSAVKRPKENIKKKPVKPVNTYNPPFDTSGDDYVKHSDNHEDDKNSEYPSEPKPFHPPLAMPEGEEAENSEDHENEHNSFLSPPPEDHNEGNTPEDDHYDSYHSKPTKSKKTSPIKAPPVPDESDTPPTVVDRPVEPHGHSAHAMNYQPPSMVDVGAGYPQKVPSMAEDDLSPPPTDDNGEKQPNFHADEYEQGHNFHYGPYDYDHHVYHEVKTTTTPAPPPDHRANYSYYFLGRKLWYIPLYFSIYFIVYVTILIIKSIARHKIQLVNNFDHTTANSRMSRDLQDTNNLYATVASSIENVGKKYM